ncbi:hypothetical protein Tco_0977862 [Tanacetum coccineum]|uniref:Uncharacterized protein n=1 Tax=Tanacetum coccineum TaxID=301880 RepID=A0ABQ5ELB7_9ASTR
MGDRVEYVICLLDSRSRAGPAESGDSCEGKVKPIRGPVLVYSVFYLVTLLLINSFEYLVVRISLEGDEILRVQGERTQGVAKTLLNTKTKVSYDLVIFCREHQCRLLRREAWSSFEVSVGITEEGEVVTYLRFIVNFSKIVKPSTSLTERNQKYEWGAEREESGVKDKILATLSEMPKVENAPAEMMRDIDQQMEKRADDGEKRHVCEIKKIKTHISKDEEYAMAVKEFRESFSTSEAAEEDFAGKKMDIVMEETYPGAYIVGNTLHYQDLEWYDALKDNELKDEALRNKAIMAIEIIVKIR